jgi:hypothetical protein
MRVRTGVIQAHKVRVQYKKPTFCRVHLLCGWVGAGQISGAYGRRTGGPGSSAKSSLFFRRKTPLLRLELFSFWTPKRTFGHDRASAKMAIQLVNAPNLVCPILSRYSFVRRAAEGAPILGPIGIGTLTQGRGAPSADPTRHCVAGPGTNLPARA